MTGKKKSFRANRDYKKHGYGFDLDVTKPHQAMLTFCIRRGGDVFRDFESALHHKELIARVYYQGLLDGSNLYKPVENNL